MSGHSQFKNIMHRKGAQDKKRAKLFSKATREIIVAVKEGGAEVGSNPRLRSALLAARSINLPKENITRAIKKAVGSGEGTDYNEVRYEGYGPVGVAVIVEGLTDNKNRAASEIRSIFTKYGGNLGELNSVSFQFQHIGEIIYTAAQISTDDIFECSLEANAQDVHSTSKTHTVVTTFADFNTVRAILQKKFGDPIETNVLWLPNNKIQITQDKTQSLLKMIDSLEDNDDVQDVFTNAEF